MDNVTVDHYLKSLSRGADRMGKYRKGKDDEDKRTITVSTRLTPAETARLDNLRGKIQRGTYLRLILTDTVPPYIPAINRQAYVELSRLGSNLNQVVRTFNTIGSSPAYMADIQRLLTELSLFLIQLRKE